MAPRHSFRKSKVGTDLKMDTQRHLFEYRHEGATWVIEVDATSRDDAWQRVCRLQEGTYLGTVQKVVPANLGLFVRLWVSLRNAFRVSGRSSA